MQLGVVESLQAWALALLFYPGLLLGVLLALVGEWMIPVARNIYVPGSRGHTRQHALSYPLSNFLKLSARQSRAEWPGAVKRGSDIGQSLLAVVCAIVPLLALAIIPFPGNPLAQLNQTGDLVTALGLLAVQPVVKALMRLRAGGLDSLRGAQDLGRLLTGLLPTLLALAALVEVSRARTLDLAAFSASPESGSQALVRLLSGGVLLFALPWWLDGRNAVILSKHSAGTYAGALLQTSALAVFWALIVLPAPGEQLWAVVLYTVGALFAYVVFRSLSEYFLPARREKDAANFVWSTALPVSIVALAVALWTGGL